MKQLLIGVNSTRAMRLAMMLMALYRLMKEITIPSDTCTCTSMDCCIENKHEEISIRQLPSCPLVNALSALVTLREKHSILTKSALYHGENATVHLPFSKTKHTGLSTVATPSLKIRRHIIPQLQDNWSKVEGFCYLSPSLLPRPSCMLWLGQLHIIERLYHKQLEGETTHQCTAWGPFTIWWSFHVFCYKSRLEC